MRSDKPVLSVLSLLLVLPFIVGASGQVPTAGTEPATTGPAATDLISDTLGELGETVGELGEGRLDSVLTAVGDALTTTGCLAPLELDPVLGCVRELGNGMLEYTAPDGAVGTTHGGDAAHDHAAHDHAEHDHDHDEPVSAASASSTALPSTRRPLQCAADGTHRTVVLYGHRQGQNDRASHLGTIRATMERSNQAIALSAKRSGGPLADLRVRCDSGGQVAVDAVQIGSARFADLRATLAAAGYDRPHEKYLLFADAPSPDPGIAGTADMFLDDRRSVNNHNNGGRAMYAVTYGERYFTGSTALHELAHTMGAVQPKAPKADGYGHCTDQSDVVCYPSSSSRCASLTFDCGNDSYFSTATRAGQWLHDHWNLGWEGHRFIAQPTASGSSAGSDANDTADEAADDAADGSFSDTPGTTHAAMIEEAVTRKIAGGYTDGTFRPDAGTRRGQMATFLTRAFDLPAGGTWRFRDVRGHTHVDGIGAVARAQVASGYLDGTFRPEGAVTRGQLATFLVRALDLPAAHSHPFTDVSGSAHEGSIAAVAAAGITSGYDDGTFRPNATVTRGQMATFLIRALDSR
ncbi:MAG: S-layer homology domain-containing protein [Nitriliruptor sp.]